MPRCLSAVGHSCPRQFQLSHSSNERQAAALHPQRDNLFLIGQAGRRRFCITHCVSPQIHCHDRARAALQIRGNGVQLDGIPSNASLRVGPPLRRAFLFPTLLKETNCDCVHSESQPSESGRLDQHDPRVQAKVYHFLPSASRQMKFPTASPLLPLMPSLTHMPQL